MYNVGDTLKAIVINVSAKDRKIGSVREDARG